MKFGWGEVIHHNLPPPQPLPITPPPSARDKMEAEGTCPARTADWVEPMARHDHSSYARPMPWGSSSSRSCRSVSSWVVWGRRCHTKFSACTSRVLKQNFWWFTLHCHSELTWRPQFNAAPLKVARFCGNPLFWLMSLWTPGFLKNCGAAKTGSVFRFLKNLPNRDRFFFGVPSGPGQNIAQSLRLPPPPQKKKRKKKDTILLTSLVGFLLGFSL